MTNPKISKSGTYRWYCDSNFHRTDGPAIIYNSGLRRWYINHKAYYDNKSFQEAAGISDEDMLIMIIKYGNVS